MSVRKRYTCQRPVTGNQEVISSAESDLYCGGTGSSDDNASTDCGLSYILLMFPMIIDHHGVDRYRANDVTMFLKKEYLNCC